MLSVKQGGIKFHFFKSLVWLDLAKGLNPGLPAIGEHSNRMYIEYEYIYIYYGYIYMGQCPGLYPFLEYFF